MKLFKSILVTHQAPLVQYLYYYPVHFIERMTKCDLSFMLYEYSRYITLSRLFLFYLPYKPLDILPCKSTRFSLVNNDLPVHFLKGHHFAILIICSDDKVLTCSWRAVPSSVVVASQSNAGIARIRCQPFRQIKKQT